MPRPQCETHVFYRTSPYIQMGTFNGANIKGLLSQWDWRAAFMCPHGVRRCQRRDYVTRHTSRLGAALTNPLLLIENSLSSRKMNPTVKVTLMSKVTSRLLFHKAPRKATYGSAVTASKWTHSKGRFLRDWWRSVLSRPGHRTCLLGRSCPWK